MEFRAAYLNNDKCQETRLHNENHFITNQNQKNLNPTQSGNKDKFKIFKVILLKVESFSLRPLHKIIKIEYTLLLLLYSLFF